MAYGLSNGHVTDDVTCPQRCCETVRSAILATAWLLVIQALHARLTTDRQTDRQTDKQISSSIKAPSHFVGRGLIIECTDATPHDTKPNYIVCNTLKRLVKTL